MYLDGSKINNYVHTRTHIEHTYFLILFLDTLHRKNKVISNCQMYITCLKIKQKHVQWEILNETDGTSNQKQ